MPLWEIPVKCTSRTPRELPKDEVQRPQRFVVVALNTFAGEGCGRGVTTRGDSLLGLAPRTVLVAHMTPTPSTITPRREITVRAWGLDGCKNGWFFVALGDDGPEFGVVPTLADLIQRAGPDDPVLVDIPIGLLESGDVGRRCDREARQVLSPERVSSVFPVPARQAIYAESYERPHAWNREVLGKGLSKQSWAIARKIREVDELLQERPELRGRIREVHPEVCFWALGGTPMTHYKKTRAGFHQRLEILERHVPGAAETVAAAFLEHGGFDAGRDDIIDAMVAAITASRLADCGTLPDEPEVDARGIAMEMVYWRA
jgi:predicted RNase H-like nuclease